MCCCVCIIVRCVSIQLTVLSRSSQRGLRRLDITIVFWDGTHWYLCLSDWAFNAQVFLLWGRIECASCKWAVFLNFNSGLFPWRVSHLHVQSRQLFAVLSWWLAWFKLLLLWTQPCLNSTCWCDCNGGGILHVRLQSGVLFVLSLARIIGTCPVYKC